MDVTRNNLKALLPEIKSAIDNSTFIAIDCELTGLNIANDVSGYDTQKSYYEKLSKNVNKFLVIQYGLSIFRYEEDMCTFKHCAYNFYIFRKPINRNVPDVRFLCQSSSIDFLSSQGFDFNKLFKEGISYLNVSEEERYRDNLEEQRKNRVNNTNTPQDNRINISVEDQPFINDIIERIEKFIDSNEQEAALPKCNAFLRRLIYQTAQEKFSDKVSLVTKQLENRDRILCVTKLKSKEDMEKEALAKKKEENEELEEAIGFSKVIKYIANSGKLIIGHNMCLDLLHTVDKFLIPLPKDYKEFKECVTGLIPRILDTKYMSSIAPFKELISSNVLSHLLETISKDPFILPKVEIENDLKGYNLLDLKEHEAGYDAYITGIAFIGMWKYLCDHSDFDNQKKFNLAVLKPYLNKLFVMKVFDGICINLGGKDCLPKRDHVLYISFPKDWKTTHITQLFSPFGSVNISWIDDQSAYVGLQKPEQISVAIKTLSQSDTYKIMTFEKRQAMLESFSENRQTPTKFINKVKRHIQESSSPDIVMKKRIVSITASVVPSTDDDSKVVEAKTVKLLEKEELDYGVPVKRTGKRKRTISKTFEEASSWD